MKIFILSIILTVGAASSFAQPLQSQAQQPNIIVMMADDMGWGQVGVQGGTVVPSSNIDRIAKEGINLTQFYVTPVCTPTRSAFLTGRYPFRTGTEVRFNANDTAGMLLDERTLAQALQEAGYWTAIVGKWHLGSWKKAHLPMQRGFDHQYGHYGAAIDYASKKRGQIYDWHRNEKPLDEDGYSTTLIAKETSRLIKAHDGKKPFFIYVPFNAVHSPHHAAPRDIVAKYKIPGDKNKPWPRANIEIMDQAVGTILQALDDKGLTDDTLVIFLNDNGGPENAVVSNGPYRGFKTGFYEGGIRVLNVMRWPGKLKAGTQNNQLFHVADLYPTLVNLAGGSLKQPLPLDGLDIWPSLINDTPSPRNEIAYSGTTLRLGDWKYIDKSAEYVSWKAGESQLYNITKDPGETTNLIAKYPDKVKQFQARMQYWQQQVRPSEEHHKIPSFPPMIYGEGEDAMLDKAFIAKLKTTWDASKKKGKKKKGANKGKKKKAK